MKIKLLLFSLVGLMGANAYSQQLLEVNCYQSNTIYNSYFLDGNLQEYATCGANPAFYVVVYDTGTCQFWKTDYMGSNAEHDFGNMTGCKPRPEMYFGFSQSDATALAGMYDMIQQIPDGFPYVIYTPGSYSYTQVNSTSPTLAAELVSKWPVAGDEHVMVLFGIKGDASSYISDTVTDGADVGAGPYIDFSTTLAACDPFAGLEEIESKVELVYLGSGKWEIKATGQVENLELANLIGQTVNVKLQENTIEAVNGISGGIYILSGTVNGRRWSKKIRIN